MGVSVEHAARRLQSLQKENGSIIVEEHKGIRARDAGKEGPHPLTEFGHRRTAVVAPGEANSPQIFRGSQRGGSAPLSTAAVPQ